MMDTKDFRASVKAVGTEGGLAEGQVKALVSVFGNIDSVGDVVMPGAFAKDLDRWAESGDSIPFVWSHDWADPFSHIGHVVKAEETDRGLEVTAQIDDLDTNPKAQQVYRLLKGRRVTQMSFAYDVLDAAPGQKDGTDVYELRELKVHEVGPTLIGANQATELLAAKARGLATGAKAGRVLSSKNITALREARDSIDAVLATAADEPDEAPKNSGAPAPVQTDEPSQDVPRPPADEEPAGAKSAASAGAAARRARAVAIRMQMSQED